MARSEPNDAVVLTVTASAVISNRNCIISGVAVAAAATTCSVALYDPPVGTTTSTGATLRVVLNAIAADTVVWHCDGGAQFLNGCVAVVTGTGAQATVVSAVI